MRLASMAMVLLVPAMSLAQPPDGGMGGPPGGGFGPPGGGFGRGGGGGGGRWGGGRGNFDPSQLFDRMSGGKDVISRADVTDPRMQFMFDRFAQQAGVTNGQLTRQQFLDTMQQRMGQFGGGRGGAPTGNNANAPAGNNSWIESSFRRLDQNGDGLLNYDEMSEALKTERDKWDTNKDGFIDLAEYRAYAVARMQAERGAAGRGVEEDPAVIVADPAPAEEEEKRPVAYRVGKLPKELPAWFSQLDTDGDAQIGLYEWRNSGRAIEEFEKIDRNGDGFLTVDEVLRYTRVSGGVTQTPGSESQENVASNQPRVSPPGGGSTFGRGGPGGGPSAWRGGDSGGSSSSWRGGGPGGRWNRGDGGGGRSNRSRNNQEGNSEGGQRRRDRGSGSSRGDRNSQPSEQS